MQSLLGEAVTTSTMLRMWQANGSVATSHRSLCLHLEAPPSTNASPLNAHAPLQSAPHPPSHTQRDLQDPQSKTKRVARGLWFLIYYPQDDDREHVPLKQLVTILTDADSLLHKLRGLTGPAAAGKGGAGDPYAGKEGGEEEEEEEEGEEGRDCWKQRPSGKPKPMPAVHAVDDMEVDLATQGAAAASKTVRQSGGGNGRADSRSGVLGDATNLGGARQAQQDALMTGYRSRGLVRSAAKRKDMEDFGEQRAPLGRGVWVGRDVSGGVCGVVGALGGGHCVVEMRPMLHLAFSAHVSSVPSCFQFDFTNRSNAPLVASPPYHLPHTQRRLPPPPSTPMAVMELSSDRPRKRSSGAGDSTQASSAAAAAARSKYGLQQAGASSEVVAAMASEGTVGGVPWVGV
jgi:hypothetical protein